MKKILLSFSLAFLLILTGCSQTDNAQEQVKSVQKSNIPEYSGSPYIVINDNVPNFELPDKIKSYQIINELDELGRTQFVEACIGKDLMPKKDRGDISYIHPSGWHSIHDERLQDGVLYNRCHLIAHQLTGTDDARNMITGTRYLNVNGMIPFEEMVGDYIRETGNHVLYRVTPVYTGDNLLADGIYMEAMSLEDKGKDIQYHVYIYNVQPNVYINYKNGEAAIESDGADKKQDYVLNTNSKKVHLPSCDGVRSMNSRNKKEVSMRLKDILEQGYTKCNCLY